MVKFGRYVDVFQETGNAGTGLFVVPYNDIKHIADRQESSPKEEFEKTWRENLEQAKVDFGRAISRLWKDIFAKIAGHPDARGAVPSMAITMYVQEAGTEAAQDLLVQVKQIHEAATLNVEALRKLVKKYDKHCSTDERQLSPSLLPLVYTANFTIGRSMLQDGIALLRELLKEKQDDDGRENNNANRHEQIVHGRQTELEWLQRLTQSMEQDELERLVAHRGFHCVQDYSHKRPIENSLTAYETAWTNGIHHCECDISLTKDEKIVLAHDEDFSRLALDQTSPMSNKRVSDLTFKQLLSMPLTSIARPPLLMDVLRSAHAIGAPDKAQLVIEIKPGNEAAASALARMLLQHPELMQCVSVIMSFDAYAIHKIRKELLFPEERPKAVVGLLTIEASRRALEDTKQIYPKLMLLTVADAPKKACELHVAVGDLSPVESWMKSSDGSLDGVYLQFEKAMLEPEGLAALRELSQRYCIGVWMYSGKDPDDYQTFHTLVHDANVTFVNTDLPSDFRKGIVARKQLVKQA